MTDTESRNHLLVPRRSDNAAIASRYCSSTVAVETFIPKGVKSELIPERGGGGGVIRDSIERPSLGVEEINERRVLGGWDNNYDH